MKVKRIVAVMLAIVSLFGFSVSAMANSITRSVNGHSFTATTSISRSNAFAGTLSSSPEIYATVSATYYYWNEVTGQQGSTSQSSSGTAAASVSFSAQKDCYSDYVTGYHTASSGSETWSGSTLADY